MGRLKQFIRVTLEYDFQLEMLVLTRQYIHISKCNKCIVNEIGLIRHIRHYEIIKWKIAVSKR